MLALFVDQFGRSLHYCHLKFDKEAISVGGKMASIGGGFYILSNFRDILAEFIWLSETS